VHALSLYRAEARKSVRESPLLAAEIFEALPAVVVMSVETRVEHEVHSGGYRVGAEHAVLAAVALVPASGAVRGTAMQKVTKRPSGSGGR
jgi:hypothetical protein